MILVLLVLLEGTPKEPCSPPPVRARRREVAKLWVSCRAGGSSLLAAVDVTIWRRDRIASAFPFSLLRIRLGARVADGDRTYLLLPGRTQLSSSVNGRGLGMYSIPITKLLAIRYISACGIPKPDLRFQLTKMRKHSPKHCQSRGRLLI